MKQTSASRAQESLLDRHGVNGDKMHMGRLKLGQVCSGDLVRGPSS